MGIGSHAFLWSVKTGLIDLTPHATYAQANAINAAGEVVGYVDGRAFAWTQTRGLVDLGTLGGDSAQAYWVSDNGHVVGQSQTPGNKESHAFYWTPAKGMTDLGTLGGPFSSAPGCCPLPYTPAVNSRGQVIGESEIASGGPYHAFYWTSAQGMIDLTPGVKGVFSNALAINGRGEVVGWNADPSGNPRPFYWTVDRGLIELARNGQAYDISESGQVVGEYGPDYTHAFSWTRGGGLLALPAFGYSSNAYWVSNRGVIAGAAAVGSQSHAILWVPSA